MSLFIKTAGVWKSLLQASVPVRDGTIKIPTQLFLKDSGAWKAIWNAASPQTALKVLWGLAQFADTDFTGGKTDPNQAGTPYTRWTGPQDFIDSQLTNSYSGTGPIDIDLFVPFPEYAYFAYPVSQGYADIRDNATNYPGGWEGATWEDGGFGGTSGPLTVTYDDGSGPEDWYVYRTSFSGIDQMSWTILEFQ